MRGEKLFGSTHKWIMKGKAVSLLPALLTILAFVCSSLGYADADPVIKLEYVFSEPKLERINEYYSIYMPDTGKLYDDIGLPLLPVKTAKILIPQGHDVKTINIVLGKKITIDGEFMIEYAKPQIPIGSNETVEAQSNEEVYSSRNPFPGKLHSVVSTQFLSGYKILVLNLFPVEYIPALGKVSYYERMKVIVVNVPSGPPLIRRAKCRKLAQDNARVKRLVDNPSEMTTYTAEATPTEGPYEYVIITNNEMIGAFQTLADWKALKGFSTYIETIENIEATYSGSDLQEKIRNFIDYAYHNWSTAYVLLGGDGDARRGRWGGQIIPCRGVYGEAFTKTYVDKEIPCDMYYGALDGTWDNDGDGIYGEGDSSDGGTGGAGDEADFWAEVFIGRIPADNTTEAYNQIDKIIAYESSLLHTKSALLVGRQLDDFPTWGGDYKDEVYTYFPSGFPSGWTATKLYEKDGTYSQEGLIIEMNSNEHHVVNYMSHSGYLNDMGLTNDQIAGLTNTRYFLAYSQGCNAGGFDTVNLKDDCAGEHFTVENGNGGAFAYIGNSRYGFYLSGSLDGSSQQYDKEFFDAIFNESIKNIGEAFQDSKEDLQGSVGAIGSMRWCYFTLNLLGDPETPILEGSITPPAAPTNLAANADVCDQINLSWTDNSDNEGGFEIERSEDGVKFNPIDIVGPNVTTYSDTGLAENTEYWYKVRAYNASGNSDYANVANATTPTCSGESPVAPSNLTAKARGKNKIGLTWKDNSNNEDKFCIYRSLNGVDFNLCATVGLDTTSYVDTGLESKTTYYYKVCASNAYGDNCSGIVEARTK